MIYTLSESKTSEPIWLLCFTHLLVLVLLLFPIWSVDIVPMPDLPSHLARIHVLANVDSNSVLADMYEAHWEALPNLALDLFILAAAKIFSLSVAAKLFISLGVLLWMTGTAWLHSVLSRQRSFIPLFAGLFVVNASFSFGFLNFFFASGIAIVGIAAWVATSKWGPVSRLTCFALIAILAYFSHIMGFLILAAGILGFELGRELAEERLCAKRIFKRLALASIPLIPVVALYALLVPRGVNAGVIQFAEFLPSFRRIKYSADLIFKEPYKLALGCVAALCALGLVTRSLAIDRRMWPILIGLGLAALLAPVKAMTGAEVHIRLPGVVSCLTVASLRDYSGRTMKTVVIAVVLALMIYRTFVTSEAWMKYDREYSELARAIEMIEPASKIFLAQPNPRSQSEKAALMTYSHYLDLISVQRSIFTTLVFAWPGQHPLRTRGNYREISSNSAYEGIPPPLEKLQVLAEGDPEGSMPRHAYLKRWQCNFDFVVVTYIKESMNPDPGLLRPLHIGSFFTIFGVIKPRDGCE